MHGGLRLLSKHGMASSMFYEPNIILVLRRAGAGRSRPAAKTTHGTEMNEALTAGEAVTVSFYSNNKAAPICHSVCVR